MRLFGMVIYLNGHDVKLLLLELDRRVKERMEGERCHNGSPARLLSPLTCYR